ncbi:retron Ec67 family RNA-directed DNA polymerase/endonuclease [Anaerotignum propionicum]|uniref:retron Ec67 family RNA-directed DNA polymerase/endonuclease n=1 Tax=Anaerotignum propionicum TaxID=28446 RepID=UPI002896BEB3|nr:retron Ec67 family RNA-directed DNA polymerase/endonuclease [Anaerotignum propionicum]
MKKFNSIATRNELADFLEIPRNKLTHILYIKKVENSYTSFSIPKKNNDKRCINAPADDLKNIQKKLANALWEYQKNIWKEKGINPYISHGFEKNKSIITNASVHRNKRYVLNIDLENFFDSFHFGRVRGFFQNSSEFRLPYEVSIVIAQLTCYKGCLPQGAPSSPIITNLICKILDNRLLGVAKKYKLDYTRYADDLTFSTNNKAFLDKLEEFYLELSKEIERAGFKINSKKTRLQFRDAKQEVTGLIVNKKLNVDRTYYKRTKAMSHSLYTKGEFKIVDTPGTIKQLEGRFAFINQLDWYNNKIDKTKNHDFRNLNSREKQYQKFLFYKYFFANDKPIIVTEGKTDIIYLKAALKGLYAYYPDLITKSADGKFEYNVCFFRKSKRINFFLGVSADGADAMKNLYNYFDAKTGDKKIYPDFLSYFNKICNGQPKNPVVFVFDNELANNKKPLNNFVNHIKLVDTKREALINDLSIKLIDNGNLFLVTNPLVKGKKECEIEDLFDIKTLEHKINGKTFSRIKGYDTNKYYGKDKFSKYISANYEKIDFSEFKSILDNLNKIIK